MFEGVEAGGDDGGGSSRVAVSTGVSLIVYGIIGAVLIAVGGSFGASMADDDDEPIQVSFQAPAPEPVAELPPPPPPAPKPEKNKRKKKGNKPPTAPVEISEEKLAEGNEGDFMSSVTEDSLADIGDPLGDDPLGDLGGGIAPPPPPPPPPAATGSKSRYGNVKSIEYLPDTAEKPVAKAGNQSPEYPDDARKKGREGLVVLRIVVTVDGRVGDVEVLSGDEPFVSAAIAAVKTWRYSPAMVDGRAEAVHRRVRLPFRLKAA